MSEPDAAAVDPGHAPAAGVRPPTRDASPADASPADASPADAGPPDAGAADTETGVPAVDDAARRLRALDDVALEDHVEVYEDVHRRLQEGLADLDEQ